MSNEPLRQAMQRAGLTSRAAAERLQVDDKTVQRWVAGRTPLPVHRRALAGLLGVHELDLWPGSPPGPRPLNARQAIQRLAGLESELRAVREEVRTLEEECRAYIDALWRIVEHSAIRMRVARRTISYEIGAGPQDDHATDTWEIEAMDGHPGVQWWLLAVGGSGKGVPPKSLLRQLERFEAEEVLDGGAVRRVPVLYLDHRAGKIWTIAVFDQAAVRRTLRVHWRWEGVWNQLRSTGRDRSTLDLRDFLNLEWRSITVRFTFTYAARQPEVTAEGDASPPDVGEDLAGRVVYSFRLDRPEHAHYAWHLRVDAMPEDHATRP